MIHILECPGSDSDTCQQLPTQWGTKLAKHWLTNSAIKPPLHLSSFGASSTFTHHILDCPECRHRNEHVAICWPWLPKEGILFKNCGTRPGSKSHSNHQKSLLWNGGSVLPSVTVLLGWLPYATCLSGTPRNSMSMPPGPVSFSSGNLI